MNDILLTPCNKGPLFALGPNTCIFGGAAGTSEFETDFAGIQLPVVSHGHLRSLDFDHKHREIISSCEQYGMINHAELNGPHEKLNGTIKESPNWVDKVHLGGDDGK